MIFIRITKYESNNYVPILVEIGVSDASLNTILWVYIQMLMFILIIYYIIKYLLLVNIY